GVAAASPGPGAMAVHEMAQAEPSEPGPLEVPSPVWRPWRFTAGFAFACATATKWSGLSALAAGALVAFAWEVSRRRSAGVHRPVSYYFKSPGTEVLGMAHPLLFWSSIVTIPVVAWRWVRRRDWRAGFILLAVLFQYLSWFVVASRVEFLFYMTPVTPFLVLG